MFTVLTCDMSLAGSLIVAFWGSVDVHKWIGIGSDNWTPSFNCLACMQSLRVCNPCMCMQSLCECNPSVCMQSMHVHVIHACACNPCVNTMQVYACNPCMCMQIHACACNPCVHAIQVYACNSCVHAIHEIHAWMKVPSLSSQHCIHILMVIISECQILNFSCFQQSQLIRTRPRGQLTMHSSTTSRVCSHNSSPSKHPRLPRSRWITVHRW